MHKFDRFLIAKQNFRQRKINLQKTFTQKKIFAKKINFRHKKSCQKLSLQKKIQQKKIFAKKKCFASTAEAMHDRAVSKS